MSYIDIDGLSQQGKPAKIILAVRNVEYRYGYMAREGRDLVPITTKTTTGIETVKEGFVHPNDARLGNEPKLIEQKHIVNCHLTEDEQRALRRRQRNEDGPRTDQPRRDHGDREE